MNGLRLRYDDANMWEKNIGKGGTTSAEWKAMLKRLTVAKRAVQKLARTKEQGFLNLPFDRKGHAASVALARTMKRKFTDMVVLGIGGSDLGARALQQALVGTEKKQKGIRVHYAGATTDPEDLAALLSGLNLKKTAINVISKSGDTIEPMSVFSVLREKLERVVGEKKAADHIVATTDPSTGSLRALARKKKYAMLPVPQNVGGRFSVLSSVGLFPAAAMGIDTEALLSGARAGVDAFHEHSASQCASCRFAGLHAVGAEERTQNIQVTVAYSSRLSEFGRWTRQLIAESLGKKKNRAGRTVYAGLTPIACVGPEDQHSQLQLWSEGPADKQLTFIEVEKFQNEFTSPFGPLSDLIHLEREATAEALRQDGRPNGTVFVERLDARALGELIVFLEASTAILGELFDVNAYDQPGVETMKRILRQKLDKLA
jgi:glucose-6-phosphate isomerase